MFTQRVRAAHLLWGVLALVGCGGGETAQDGAVVNEEAAAKRGAIEACSLLTAEEIATVTGARVAEITPDTFGTVGTCNYNVTGELMPVVSVILAPNMTDVSSSAEMVAWRKSQLGTSYGDIKVIFTPIEGLGVPAIRNEVEGVGLVTVEAAVKGMLLDVTTSSLDMSQALIPKAIARLP